MLGGGGFGSNQNQQSSGGLFGTSNSFGVGIGQQGVSQNNINSSMQQPSLFGSSTPLFSGGNLGSGLFSNTNTSGTGFGVTGSSSGFGQSSSGLFCQSMGAFGNNQQIGSTQPNIFGSGGGTNTGIFGSSTGNSSGIFGSFNNSFGSTGFGSQVSQQNNSSGFFGQQTNTSIFGSSPVQGFGNVSSSPFGGTLGTNSNIFSGKKGTNGITFQPLVDRDSDARIMSIVYQKDVDQKKSVEELRWEDYQEKRGPSSSLPKSDLGFQSNPTNTFGTSSFSNSGFFGSNSQNQSISNSLFGQSQNSSFLSSTNPQNSIFGSNNSSLGQPSVLGQGVQPGQQNLGSSQFGSGNNAGLFGNTSTNTNSFSLQNSPNTTTTGIFSSGLFSSNTGNSGLFGQTSTNSNIFDNSLKTSGGLFGNSTTTPSSDLNLFGTNNNNQQQFSLGAQSLGNKSLFGNSQPPVNSGVGGSILSGASELSSGSSILGSTQPKPSGLLTNNANSGSLLFGSSSLSQSLMPNNNSLSISSNLFGNSSALSQTLSTGNTTLNNSIWPNIAPNQTNSNFSATNSVVNEVSSNNQYHNILGTGTNKTISNPQTSISTGTNFSNSNTLSNNNIMRPASQNLSRYSDSADRGKTLWLWKPLPQYISRPSRYKLDTSAHINVADKSVSSSELALPALATECSRHNSLLLSSVRRVEKTVDLQTPATFLTLLERQQQFFDALQSPDSNNTSPANTKVRSMIFSKPHTSYSAKITSIDENFEDAIDDSNPVFSPKTNTYDRKPNSEGTKSLLNLESISRISQNIQFSKKSEIRGSIGRTSVESNNASRTPHSTQQRASINSIIVGSDRHQTRTSIGLTTPRPILRRFDNLNGDNLINETNKSNQFQKEQVVGSLVPILTKSDYLCIPSIEVLRTFSEDRLAIVEDFRIIREGVGEIMWPGVTDLRGINLDLVVSIEPLCVSVYGDDDSPVPIGEGLNKKALVTLKNCKPKKMMSLTDANEIEIYKNNRVNQIKNYTEQMGARFISLDTNTWEWKFEVSHFSRYGLVSRDGVSTIDNLQFPVNASVGLKNECAERSFTTNSEQNLNGKLSAISSGSSDHFFYKKSQYNETSGFYSEAMSVLGEYKLKEKGKIYNNLSFRGGIYIGSYALAIIPHRPLNTSPKCFYNTSVTIFKLKQSQFSLKNAEGQAFGLPRRTISFWLRMYMEIIGNPADTKNLSLDSVLKLTFLMWDVIRKELLLTSNNIFNRIDSPSENLLKYYEETLCFLAGILEILVQHENKLSQVDIEGRINEYFLCWIRFVNDKRICIKKNTLDKREVNYGIDSTISKLSSIFQSGNLTSLVSTHLIEGFLEIPRTASLCLSIGSNKSSMEQFKRNFQWWVGIGICSDFSDTAFKLYKSIANMDLMSHILDNWPIFRLMDGIPNQDISKCERADIKMVYERSAIRSVIADEDIISENSRFYKHRLFDIQFQIMNFFTAKNKFNSIKLLENLYRSNYNTPLDFSFCWFITRILTLCHQILYKDEDVLFSQQKLHLLFINELELLGMWEWAAYIAIHLDLKNKLHSSANIFNSIITRNISEIGNFSRPDEYIESNKWNFLVNTIGIPLPWLIEAMIYKSNANGNIIQSIKFAIYLIDYFKNKKYKPGDLFFQHKSLNSTQVINYLLLFVFVKLFDSHVFPRTLIEISATLWNEVENGGNCSNNGYLSNSEDINQFQELEKLHLLINNTRVSEPVPEDIWRIANLIINVSHNFILLSTRTLGGECFNKESSDAICSLINEILSARKNTNMNSIEFPIVNIIKDDCWEVISKTLETIS